MMIFFWAFLILLVVWCVRGMSGKSGCGMGGMHSSSSSSALDTLKERYAKGEIDKKEFEQKKKDLMDA